MEDDFLQLPLTSSSLLLGTSSVKTLKYVPCYCWSKINRLCTRSKSSETSVDMLSAL